MATVQKDLGSVIGPQGKDGNAYVSFEITADGNLVAYYEDENDVPDFELAQNGDLIYKFGESGSVVLGNLQPPAYEGIDNFIWVEDVQYPYYSGSTKTSDIRIQLGLILNGERYYWNFGMENPLTDKKIIFHFDYYGENKTHYTESSEITDLSTNGSSSLSWDAPESKSLNMSYPVNVRIELVDINTYIGVCPDCNIYLQPQSEELSTSDIDEIINGVS